MKAIPFKHQNVVIAKDQPEYRPLPALKIIVPRLEINDPDGHVVFCMGLSFKERLRVLFLGKIWVSLMTFGKLTPSYLTTYRKEVYTHSDFGKFQRFMDLGAIIYFDLRLWASYTSSKMGWFRIFGVGLCWKHESKGLMFSERNGYRKYIKIGKWIIKFLS